MGSATKKDSDEYHTEKERERESKMSMMKRFFVTMAVAAFVVFASVSHAGEEPMMANDTAMNMTMNDTMMNMTMNGTDMANDTIAEEEPASDDGRRRLLDMHESMNDTMGNDTMGNMTMNETDMAYDTIAEEEPASSDDG